MITIYYRRGGRKKREEREGGEEGGRRGRRGREERKEEEEGGEEGGRRGRRGREAGKVFKYICLIPRLLPCRKIFFCRRSLGTRLYSSSIYHDSHTHAHTHTHTHTHTAPRTNPFKGERSYSLDALPDGKHRFLHLLRCTSTHCNLRRRTQHLDTMK